MHRFPLSRATIAACARACAATVPANPAHPTGTRLADDDRVLGEDTLDQIRADLNGLAELGAEYVVLDTYLDPARRRTAEEDWHILETVAAVKPG